MCIMCIYVYYIYKSQGGNLRYFIKNWYKYTSNTVGGYSYPGYSY